MFLLRQAVETKTEATSPNREDTEMNCPNCNTPMVEHRFYHCDNCGQDYGCAPGGRPYRTTTTELPEDRRQAFAQLVR